MESSLINSLSHYEQLLDVTSPKFMPQLILWDNNRCNL